MSALAFNAGRIMAKIPPMIAYGLGATIGAVAGDLRSLVTREGWRRGGHMRALPLDLLAPGVTSTLAIAAFMKLQQHDDFDLWFKHATGDIQRRIYYEIFGRAMSKHAALWVPSDRYFVGVGLVFVVLHLAVLYWRGQGSILGGGLLCMAAMLQISWMILTIEVIVLPWGTTDPVRSWVMIQETIAVNLFGLLSLRFRHWCYSKA